MTIYKSILYSNIHTERPFLPDAPEHFHYTSQGGQMQIPGTDDLADLERTRNAFTILGREKTHTRKLSHLNIYENLNPKL